MPLYDYECPLGHSFEAVTPINEMATCPHCEMTARRVMITPVKFSVGVPAYGYYDENLETYIHSNAHKREVMDQQGVYIKGETPKNGQAWV